MRTLAVLASCLLLLGCDGPTDPSLRGLDLSHSTATVARTASVQVSATARLENGGTEDVTQRAVWASSDSLIASVSAGLITGRRPGLVTITASYQGVTKELSLIVRSRMQIRGTATITNVAGTRTLDQLYLRVDGRDIGYDASGENELASLTVSVGEGTFDPSVDPGAHEIALWVGHRGPAQQYRTDMNLVVIDADSGLQLQTLTLSPVVTTIDTYGALVRWTIDVPIHSR